MIRVVIADDQALVRGGIKMILQTQADIEVVGEAADGDAAVAMARKLTPDVILMDIRMPGTDGVQATRAITRDRAPGDKPRVLVVTTFDLDHYVYQALKAGASGFLLKDEPPENSPPPSAPWPPVTRCWHRYCCGGCSTNTSAVPSQDTSRHPRSSPSAR
jgi:DNA-binding NarL/FixJ family response regulator